MINMIDGAFQLEYSAPGPIYYGTKAGIEALSGITNGAIAVASDNPSAPIGSYVGGSWIWAGGAGGGVASVTGSVVDNTDPANPVINADAVGAAATAETNAKAYADGLVVGLWDDRGNFDASVNAYPSTGGSGTAGAIKKGDIWTVSVAGTLPTSQVVEIGDTVRALVDTPGNTQANWAVAQQNIGYTAENSANKSADVETDKASTTKYPTVKALYDWAVGKFALLTGTRELLSANRTYYVRTDGNDSNTGLVNNSGGAFLTPQRAINVAASIDTSIYGVIIQIADGTNVTNQITCKNIIGSGTVTIQGNSGTPANVIIDGGFYKTTPGTTYIIKDLKLIKSSGSTTTAIYSSYGALIQFSNINFSTGFVNHVYMYGGGIVAPIGNYEISSGATYHWIQESQGFIEAQGITITLTGTPAFTIFLLSSICSTVRVYGITFSGSATGQRYVAQLGSVIQTFGGGANVFPGNAPGSITPGGQYN